jgi:hypothetical protein
MRRVKRGTIKRTRLLAPFPGGAQARALAKVGSGDLTRLRWLLDLLNRSPETFAHCSQSGIKDLESEAAVFCEAIGSFTSGPSSSLTASMIAQLGHEIQKVVFGFLEGASHDFQIPCVSLAVIPNSASRYIGAADAIFRLAVARLIETDGHRIRRCARPGCDRLFVRRKRALYCGKKCSQLAQFARYVKRHASDH